MQILLSLAFRSETAQFRANEFVPNEPFHSAHEPLCSDPYHTGPGYDSCHLLA
jgi:hypothetical protein